MRLDRPEPSSLWGSTSVPEQLNIKAVTGACKLIDDCSLELCSATPSATLSGICHRNKVNSIKFGDGLKLMSVSTYRSTFCNFVNLKIEVLLCYSAIRHDGTKYSDGPKSRLLWQQ